MIKIYSLLFTAAVFLTCSCTNKETVSATGKQNEFTLYAPAVKDSFFISVQLPDAYNKDSAKSFPVVYMTDANFHFSMLAATLKEYEQGGLLPPLILVGIGYRSFQLMDSLRVRDYLYPAALPSDEMTAVGGGKNFDAFITG
jgi:predicted alpha/beta superfamily hydrolase